MKTKEVKSQKSIQEDTYKLCSTELIVRSEIEKTPFTFIKENDKLGFIAMGKYKLTNNLFVNKAEAELYLEENKYMIMLNVIGIVIEYLNKE